MEMSLSQALTRLSESLQRLDHASILAEVRAQETIREKEMALESMTKKCESLRASHQQALSGLDALSERLHNLLDS